MLFEEKKKAVAPKPNIKIKNQLHHRVPENKLFKTRSHLRGAADPNQYLS
jgi:hypothetical protein